MDEEQALENALDGSSTEETLSDDDAAAEDVAATADTVHELPIAQSLRPDLSHGPKPAEFQRYIVLHDTEGGGTPYDVIDGWESDGNFIASHFIVGRDGEVVQVVPMDEIAHHAGFGDAGHNDLYGTTDESRDDRRGTTPIGDWAPDYGMNSYSIGIELVHQGSTGEDYPEEQLQAEKEELQKQLDEANKQQDSGNTVVVVPSGGSSGGSSSGGSVQSSSGGRTITAPAGYPPVNVDSSGYVLPQSAYEYIDYSDLAGMNDWELACARNEIFARYGYPFQQADQQEFYAQMPWYSRDSGYSVSRLSDMDWANVNTIRALENER